MVKNKLEQGEEMWGVSGVEDVSAYKRNVEVKDYRDKSISINMAILVNSIK